VAKYASDGIRHPTKIISRPWLDIASNRTFESLSLTIHYVHLICFQGIALALDLSSAFQRSQQRTVYTESHNTLGEL
jgi:hypothetical protein